ncbi:hypothetical protein B0H14DRAFT_3428427 [Mycena olivaceomarginata]|nr:hypothetical protein B0H14DRAFT_3428427 [Mycena olivaceomarginata]
MPELNRSKLELEDTTTKSAVQESSSLATTGHAWPTGQGTLNLNAMAHSNECQGDRLQYVNAIDQRKLRLQRFVAINAYFRLQRFVAINTYFRSLRFLAINANFRYLQQHFLENHSPSPDSAFIIRSMSTPPPPHKIRLFSQRNRERDKLLPPGPPSIIIKDMAGPHTASELQARSRLVQQQRAALLEQVGYAVMYAQIAVLFEIDAWPLWQQTRERKEREELEKAKKDLARRERIDERSRLCREEYVRRRGPRAPSIRRRPGRRVDRATPLGVDDLYLDDARPPELDFPPLLLTCTLCFNVKSHPVS